MSHLIIAQLCDAGVIITSSITPLPRWWIWSLKSYVCNKGLEWGTRDPRGIICLEMMPLTIALITPNTQDRTRTTWHRMWPGPLLLLVLGCTFTLMVATFANIRAPRKRGRLSFGDWGVWLLVAVYLEGWERVGIFKKMTHSLLLLAVTVLSSFQLSKHQWLNSKSTVDFISHCVELLRVIECSLHGPLRSVK